MSRDPQCIKEVFDLVLVGGGLQNGLIALKTLHAVPSARIALIEMAPTLGGNHTWCVHARDLSESARVWFEPLIVQRYRGYDVSFPGLKRSLESAYAVVSSERFDQVLQARFAEAQPRCRLFTSCRVSAIEPQHVVLADGTLVHGRLIIDARGPDPKAFVGRAGYQKFVGLELQTRAPHGLQQPILMDATCTQSDGFRFFYVLPFAADRLLIEETRFSRSPRLDLAAGRSAVNAYATRFGSIVACVREEQGVLPMPWSLPDAFFRDVYASPLVAGYRGGYFHPATGYSLPAAARVAELIGDHVMAEPLGRDWQRFVRCHRTQVSYALRLNRLLFSGFAETDMWGVFERFYRLPEDLIARFYALSLSWPDRARIVVGRPPRGFSIARALAFAGDEA